MLKIPNRTLDSAPSLVCAVHKTAHPPPALGLKICSLTQCMAQTECWSTIFLFLTPHILIPQVSKSSWPLIQNIFWIYSSNIYILLYGSYIIHIYIYIIYTYIYTAYLTRSPQSPVRTVLVLPIWPPCFPLAAFSTQPSENSFKTWTRLFHSDLKFSHGFTSTENKIQIPFYGQGALRDLAPVGLSDFIFSLSLIFCKDVKLTPTSGLWDFFFSALPDISMCLVFFLSLRICSKDTSSEKTSLPTSLRSKDTEHQSHGKGWMQRVRDCADLNTQVSKKRRCEWDENCLVIIDTANSVAPSIPACTWGDHHIVRLVPHPYFQFLLSPVTKGLHFVFNSDSQLIFQSPLKVPMLISHHGNIHGMVTTSSLTALSWRGRPINPDLGISQTTPAAWPQLWPRTHSWSCWP